MFVNYEKQGISLLTHPEVSEPELLVRAGTHWHSLDQNGWSPAIDYLITRIWLGYVGSVV